MLRGGEDEEESKEAPSSRGRARAGAMLRSSRVRGGGARLAMSMPLPMPDALRLGVEYKTEQRSVGATVKVKDFYTNEVVGQLMYTRFEPHRVPVDAPTRPRVDVTV